MFFVRKKYTIMSLVGLVVLALSISLFSPSPGMGLTLTSSPALGFVTFESAKGDFFETELKPLTGGVEFVDVKPIRTETNPFGEKKTIYSFVLTKNKSHSSGRDSLTGEFVVRTYVFVKAKKNGLAKSKPVIVFKKTFPVSLKGPNIIFVHGGKYELSFRFANTKTVLRRAAQRGLPEFQNFPIEGISFYESVQQHTKARCILCSFSAQLGD